MQVSMSVFGVIEIIGISIRVDIRISQISALDEVFFYLNNGLMLSIIDNGCNQVYLNKDAKLGSNLDIYKIHSYSKRKPRNCAFSVKICGVAKGPCSHFGIDRIELGSFSCWYPSFASEVDASVSFKLFASNAYELLYSPADYSSKLRSVICLATEKYTKVKIEVDSSQRIDLYCENSANEIINYIKSAICLWKELLGKLPFEIPPIVIIDIERSYSAYASIDFLRFPASFAFDSSARPYIFHEIGHLWWGLAKQFQGSQKWIAEGIAEYSLFLASERGFIKYDRNIIDEYRMYIARSPYCRYPLTLLASCDKNEAQLVLRMKGALLLDAIRKNTSDIEFFSNLCQFYRGKNKGFSNFQFRKAFKLSEAIIQEYLT